MIHDIIDAMSERIKGCFDLVYWYGSIADHKQMNAHKSKLNMVIWVWASYTYTSAKYNIYAVYNNSLLVFQC